MNKLMLSLSLLTFDIHNHDTVWCSQKDGGWLVGFIAPEGDKQAYESKLALILMNRSIRVLQIIAAHRQPVKPASLQKVFGVTNLSHRWINDHPIGMPSRGIKDR